MPIVTPGRRIGSAYSSSNALKKRMHRSRRNGYAALMLTSMVDMFTILVLYLIQQFNSTGQILFVDPDVKLPEAHRAVEVKGNPPVVTIDKNEVSLDGKPIELTETFRKEGQWEAPKLEEALREMREMAKGVEAATGGQMVTDSAAGLMMVQADVDVPYLVVKKVMFIASKAGYDRVDFAVTRVGAVAAKAE
jgi:biopolymer transport protein ExbD